MLKQHIDTDEKRIKKKKILISVLVKFKRANSRSCPQSCVAAFTFFFKLFFKNIYSRKREGKKKKKKPGKKKKTLKRLNISCNDEQLPG